MDPLKPSVLFVDDEPTIRLTLPAILKRGGFEVTVCAEVPEALNEITAHKYDILLTDLNLGEQGDGLMLVSAMRRVQPQAATIIITGYPGFESALRAIQAQVDEYIVKPADPVALIEKLRTVFDNRPLRQVRPLVRIFDTLSVNKEQVAKQWLEEVESDPDVRQLEMSLEERFAYLPEILDSVIALGTRGVEASITALGWAAKHGEKRRHQRYFATLLADELRVLEKLVLQMVEQNLVRINLSLLFTDLQAINELFRLLQREAIRAFLEEPVEPLAPAGA